MIKKAGAELISGFKFHALKATAVFAVWILTGAVKGTIERNKYKKNNYTP